MRSADSSGDGADSGLEALFEDLTQRVTDAAQQTLRGMSAGEEMLIGCEVATDLVLVERTFWCNVAGHVCFCLVEKCITRQVLEMSPG